MLETLKNAFKIKDVRRRIYYVVLMLVIVRIGSQLPIPGVDRDFFKQLFANQSNDAFNFRDHVYFCIEYYTVHYIIHYHSAFDDCDSEAGRNAA